MAYYAVNGKIVIFLCDGSFEISNNG